MMKTNHPNEKNLAEIQRRNDDNAQAEAEARMRANAAANETPEYAVRNIVDIAKMELPAQTFIWNGIALTPFAICGIAGSPGIGKSRFLADLARHDILRRKFAGLDTSGQAHKWLFVGTENGIHRLNTEARRFILGANADVYSAKVQELMTAKQTAERNGNRPQDVLNVKAKQAEVGSLFHKYATENGLNDRDVLDLAANYITFTLENPEDSYISLADDANVKKLTATFAAVHPDIIVIDPWGDVIDGSELDDGDVRRTVQKIRKCAADAKTQPLIFIISHARMGLKEEADARGFSAGNFMKNAKTLYSISRNFFNIRRASFDENPPIEVICAKCNDGVKPPPIALQLDPVTMSYRHIEDWDADKWQAELESKIKSRNADSAEVKTPEQSAEEAVKERQAFFDAAIEVANEAGDALLDTDTFQQKLIEKPGGKVAKNTRSQHFTALWKVATGERGILKSQHKQERKQNGTIGNTRVATYYVSTPERIKAYLRQFEELEI